MGQFDFTGSPLHQDARGMIRVIGSRITLGTLVNKYKGGDTPQDLHEGFPSLTLAQIKGVIAWYLNHTAEADEYLQRVETEYEALRREIESRPGYKEFNDLIKHRWAQLSNQRREQLTKN
jgi:uncharacterized protein (DUF433 family)